MTQLRTLLVTLGLVAGATGALERKAWSTISKTHGTATGLDSAGLARCGADEEFHFNAYRGTKNLLVVQLEGGGNCQDETTCLKELFTTSNLPADNSATCYRNSLTAVPSVPSTLNGIADHDDRRNAVRKWNHVYIPYCTCDLHLGTRHVDFANTDATGVAPTIEYASTEAGTRQFAFNGNNNFKFVMDWIRANYQEQFGQSSMPRRILFAGCSAGGYGVTLQHRNVIEAFPESKVITLADSAVGKAQSGAFITYNANMLEGAEVPYQPDEMPIIFGALQTMQAELAKGNYAAVLDGPNLSTFIAQSAAAHPEHRFASLAFETDSVIPFQRTAWAEGINMLNDAELCNVNTFILEGYEHCLIPDEDLFTFRLINNFKFRWWLAALVNDVCLEDVIGLTLAGDDGTPIELKAFDRCGWSSKCFARNSPFRVVGDETETDEFQELLVEMNLEGDGAAQQVSGLEDGAISTPSLLMGAGAGAGAMGLFIAAAAFVASRRARKNAAGDNKVMHESVVAPPASGDLETEMPEL